MKHKLIAVALALGSTTVFAQAMPAASDGQSSMQAKNGQPQTQTTVPSDKSKPSWFTLEGQKGQPVQGEKVDPWSFLGRGWKQFDNAGKQ